MSSRRRSSSRRPANASGLSVPSALNRARQALVAGGVAYAGATVGYALLRPLLGNRHGWIELADDLEPWAYMAAPALGALGAALSSGPLIAAASALSAAFGVRWGHRYLRREPDPCDASADLKVMTFNTLAWQRTGHDLEASIRSANPDIVGLQEIGPNAADHLATALADRFPYTYITRAAASAGAAVLSRYPLIDPVAFRASDRGAWWHRMVVDAPFGRFTFFNIHTKIPHVVTTHHHDGWIKLPLDFHSERRSREIRLLVEMLDRVNGPVIVVGDFNMTERSWDHRQVAQRLRDAYQAVGSGFGYSFPVVGKFPRLFPSPFPMLRLDYVWHSDHFAPAWAYRGDPGHSDHHPVIAGLRWAAEARESAGAIPLAASTV